LNDEGQTYYQEQEIVYIENRFHHPFAQEDRGSFEICLRAGSTPRELFSWRIGRYRFSMNFRAFGQGNLSETEAFCLLASPQQTKKFSLRDLCASVVNANYFSISLKKRESKGTISRVLYPNVVETMVIYLGP
jgi:hypothetical protein